MPVTTDAVGHVFPSLAIEVTPRMALAFAAAISDESEVCWNDTHPGFIAHPALCVRLEWALIGQRRSSLMQLHPDEAIRAVHVAQQSSFLHPIRPGMRVIVTGKIVEVRATRAGALVRSRITVEDSASEQRLGSTLSTALYRGVAVVGPDRQVDDGSGPPASSEELIVVPREYEDLTLSFDRYFPHRYSECAGIWNPIHTELAVAQSAGLRTILVHGTAIWAIAGRELIRRYVPGAPHRLTSLAARFSGMVFAGESVTLRHGPLPSDGAASVAFSVLNADGREVLSDGLASFS